MKPRTIFIAAVTSTIIFWSLSSAAKTVVEMKDAQGKSVGTVTIVDSGTGEKGSGVGLNLDLHDLPPGTHGIHFHKNAKCDGPDFKSAGPHFNPDGHHAGDMMNFSVNEQGVAKLKVTDDDVLLGDGTSSHSLFSNGGTALVIHADADDMKTDPAGNSGARIACGTVTK